MSKEQISAAYQYEVMDRASCAQKILASMFERHPGMNPSMEALYAKAMSALGDLYQEAATRYFYENK